MMIILIEDAYATFDQDALESTPNSGDYKDSTPVAARYLNYPSTGSSSALGSAYSVSDGIFSVSRASLSSASCLDESLTKEREIIVITKTLLPEAKLKEITDHINENREKYADEMAYLPRASTGLSRTLEYCKDGTFYIHFNKLEEDQIVGRGKSKKAKFTFAYDSNALCIRTTGLGDCTDEINFFDRVKDIPGTAKLLHSRTFESKREDSTGKRLIKTEMIMPFYSKGVLSKIDSTLSKNGIIDPDQIGSIKTNIGESVLETIAEFHKRGLTHGDLHEGNIFLDEDFKAVVADFGSSRTNQSINAQRNDKLALDRLFQEILGSSHPLCKAMEVSSTVAEGLSKYKNSDNYTKRDSKIGFAFADKPAF